jgi:hypothetical protein
MATTSDINAGVAAARPKLRAIIEKVAPGFFVNQIESAEASAAGLADEEELTAVIINAVDASRAKAGKATS